MGLEVCCTLGMLQEGQAQQLKDAGLTSYNHNMDSSREFYPKVISTRSYDERLQTLDTVRDAGLKICSGQCCRLVNACIHVRRANVVLTLKKPFLEMITRDLLLPACLVMTGGILGLGESADDRISMLHTLATLPRHPDSVPINALVAAKGTPLQDQKVGDHDHPPLTTTSYQPSFIIHALARSMYTHVTPLPLHSLDECDAEAAGQLDISTDPCCF